jgi:peptidoglycan/xylan/chitin deacetylase (PgdA/CDA1 family)
MLVFILSRKPFCFHNIPERKNLYFEVSPFPFGFKGALCISADFEMSWAWRYAKNKPEQNIGMQERDNFPRLIELSEQYAIPITWAVVGHLFLRDCEKLHRQMKHPEMLRPSYFTNRNWEFSSGDWYDDDPCTDYVSNPDWYAPDLIQNIMCSSVEHEIACHTFSHIDFSYENCPEELAENEISRCIQVMEKYGLRPRSFIFPGGTIGNYETLIRNGFTTTRYRKGRLELAYPYKNSAGLWVINTSASLEGDPSWSVEYSIKRIKKYIDDAIKNNLVCHLWFHPSANPATINTIFSEIFRYAQYMNKKGELWIATMKEISGYCEIREKTMFKMNRTSGGTIVSDIAYCHDNELFRTNHLSLNMNPALGHKLKMVRMDGRECPTDNVKSNKKFFIDIPLFTERLEMIFK